MNGDSLDEPTTYVVSSDSGSMPPPAAEPSGGRAHLPHWRLIVLGAVILVVAALVIIILHSLSKPAQKPPATVVINTQNLNAGTLSKLENENGANGGTPQLTIIPNTLFKNNTDVQNNLAVNGTATVQGATSLNNSLTVNGSLRVSSATNIGGDLSVSGLITASGLSVGKLTINNLQLAGDINFGGHFVSTGAVPAIVASPAAGSGATASVTGSDVTGTITITMGSGSTSVGQLAQLTFHTTYKLSPQVQLTPVNADSAGLQYYVTQSANYFTVNTASAPSANKSYTFNYLVTQ